MFMLILLIWGVSAQFCDPNLRFLNWLKNGDNNQVVGHSFAADRHKLITEYIEDGKLDEAIFVFDISRKLIESKRSELSESITDLLEQPFIGHAGFFTVCSGGNAGRRFLKEEDCTFMIKISGTLYNGLLKPDHELFTSHPIDNVFLTGTIFGDNIVVHELSNESHVLDDVELHECDTRRLLSNYDLPTLTTKLINWLGLENDDFETGEAIAVMRQNTMLAMLEENRVEDVMKSILDFDEYVAVYKESLPAAFQEYLEETIEGIGDFFTTCDSILDFVLPIGRILSEEEQDDANVDFEVAIAAKQHDALHRAVDEDCDNILKVKAEGGEVYQALFDEEHPLFGQPSLEDIPFYGTLIAGKILILHDVPEEDEEDLKEEITEDTEFFKDDDYSETDEKRDTQVQTDEERQSELSHFWKDQSTPYLERLRNLIERRRDMGPIHGYEPSRKLSVRRLSGIPKQPIRVFAVLFTYENDFDIRKPPSEFWSKTSEFLKNTSYGKVELDLDIKWFDTTMEFPFT
eukprot:TRINITY_DN22554_c0_g2_i1.p1 TRINITY_DN22554_c0_g2~~TRINITY_DN22554_c0_g2_i1.p1  ORF type:complete len:542 (-),score=174.13 TRINITY_DN22554_c0_g2_i1:79-1632(-)